MGSRVLCLVLLSLLPGACKRTASTAGPDPSLAERFPAVRLLPDPFLLGSGKRVATRAEWARRRTELSELLLRHEYGHAPPAPTNALPSVLSEENVGDAGTRRLVKLALGPERRVTIHLGLIVPPGSGRRPAVVNIDHRGPFAATFAPEIARRGYVFVGYDPTFLDPDQPDALGPAQAAYPDRDWATLAVWAWGASRVVDYLAGLPEVDPRRVVLTGHSRSGKTALLAGALDERIALVAPMCSGTGGAASYRFRGASSESLDAITKNFPHWFQPSLRGFVGNEDRLPFDQHFLWALVAPRPLLVLEARGDLWANHLGTQQAFLAARAVYGALGATDRVGIGMRDGEHEQTDEDWRALLELADHALSGAALPDGRRFDVLPLPESERPFTWTAPKLR